MRKIKHFFVQSWLLIVASFCFGVLLAVTNAALAPRIEQNRINKLNRLAGDLMNEFYRLKDVSLPEDVDFAEFIETEVMSPQGKKVEVKVHEVKSKAGERFGWTFNAVGTGFQGNIELVIGFDAQLKTIAGYNVLFSNETVGFGDKIADEYYRSQFRGAPLGQLRLLGAGEGKSEKIDSDIVAISGATISSKAVVKIFNAFVEEVKAQIQKQLLKKESSNDK